MRLEIPRNPPAAWLHRLVASLSSRMMRRVFLTLMAAVGVAAYFLIPKVLRQPEDTGGGATSAPSPHAQAPAVLPSKLVLLIGDSIAVGYAIGDLTSTGYLPYVQQDLLQDAVVMTPKYADGRPENCAGTDFSLQHIDRLLQPEGGKKWDVIHFNWGLHDAKHETADGKPSDLATDPPQTSVEQYEQQLRELVGKLKATGAKLIFATSTPVPPGKIKPYRSDEELARYNEAALRVMQENGVAVNDLYSFIKPRLAELQLPANVHFNPEGCHLLGQQVAKSVKSALQ